MDSWSEDIYYMFVDEGGHRARREVCMVVSYFTIFLHCTVVVETTQGLYCLQYVRLTITNL